jgi:hypothetical protein
MWTLQMMACKYPLTPVYATTVLTGPLPIAYVVSRDEYPDWLYMTPGLFNDATAKTGFNANVGMRVYAGNYGAEGWQSTYDVGSGPVVACTECGFPITIPWAGNLQALIVFWGSYVPAVGSTIEFAITPYAGG